MTESKIIEIRKSRNGRFKVLIECLNCGAQKWVKHVTIKNGNGKFCSRSCSREYKKAHPEEYRAPKPIINKRQCNLCTIVLTNKQSINKYGNKYNGIIWGAYRNGSSLCYRCQIKLIARKLGRGITNLFLEKLKDQYFKKGYHNMSDKEKQDDIDSLCNISDWEIKKYLE